MSSQKTQGEQDLLQGEQITAKKARAAKHSIDYRARKRTAIGKNTKV